MDGEIKDLSYRALLGAEDIPEFLAALPLLNALGARIGLGPVSIDQNGWMHHPYCYLDARNVVQVRGDCLTILFHDLNDAVRCKIWETFRADIDLDALKGKVRQNHPELDAALKQLGPGF